jgi:hypothetical protein
MKKTSIKKLGLNKESLRRLDQDQLANAPGGVTTNCDSENSICGLCRTISCLC